MISWKDFLSFSLWHVHDLHTLLLDDFTCARPPHQDANSQSYCNSYLPIAHPKKKKLFTWCTLVSVSYDDNFKVFFWSLVFLLSVFVSRSLFSLMYKAHYLIEVNMKILIASQDKWNEAKQIFFFLLLIHLCSVKPNVEKDYHALLN